MRVHRDRQGRRLPPRRALDACPGARRAPTALAPLAEPPRPPEGAATRASPRRRSSPRRVSRRRSRVAASVAWPAVALAVAVDAAAPGRRCAAGAACGLGLAVVAGRRRPTRPCSAASAARLELARRTLREARKRRFDGLAALADAANRDEVDALIRQVYGAGRALQAEIERLETLETYRRDFLGDVSHELRTPIFAVTGFAETLLDGALDDDRVRRRFVEKVLANAQPPRSAHARPHGHLEARDGPDGPAPGAVRRPRRSPSRSPRASSASRPTTASTCRCASRTASRSPTATATASGRCSPTSSRTR